MNYALPNYKNHWTMVKNTNKNKEKKKKKLAKINLIYGENKWKKVEKCFLMTPKYNGKCIKKIIKKNKSKNTTKICTDLMEWD